MPRVSFVATIYNKRPHLPFLVAGLSAQTGPFEREFIFVDDGSTDGGAEHLAELAAGLENVTIIRQANQGPAVAQNAGFAAASGDYLKPIDGDDVLAPWATRRLLEAMTARQCRWGFLELHRAATYALTEAPEAVLARLQDPGLAPEPAPDLLQLTLRRAQTNPSAWLAERSAVLEAGGCDERVFVQDYSIELRLACRFPAVRAPGVALALPATLEGRVSQSQAQTLHDVNYALAWHIADGAPLPADLRRLALKRMAHRAWSWGRRRAGLPVWSKAARMSALAAVGLLPVTADTAFATCDVFQKRVPLRVPGPGARDGLPRGQA